jgi:agmatinase
MAMLSQPRTFFDAPLTPNPDEITADIAFLGVPFGTTAGTVDSNLALGPRAVRDTNIFHYAGRPGDRPAQGWYDYDTDTEYLKGVTMVDCGDVRLDRSDPDATFNGITDAVRRIVNRGAFPVVIGGSHAISAYSCKAVAEKYPDLDVVHIDAHHDYYYGPNYGWTGALRRIDLVCGDSLNRLTTMGIRPNVAPQTGRDMYDDMKKRGVQIVTAKRFRELGPRDAMALVPEEDRPIYITLDIDVLDAPFNYAFSAAASNGLTYSELSGALQELTTRGRVVGIDLVDCLPTNVTPLVGGQLLLDLLSKLFPSKT